MIKTMFRAVSDRKVLAELQGSSQFRFYVDKLRHAHDKAIEDMMHCAPRDLPDRRGYARAIAELLEASTRTGENP